MSVTNEHQIGVDDFLLLKQDRSRFPDENRNKLIGAIQSELFASCCEERKQCATLYELYAQQVHDNQKYSVIGDIYAQQVHDNQKYSVIGDIYTQRLQKELHTGYVGDVILAALAFDKNKSRSIRGSCVAILRKLAGFVRKYPFLYRIATAFGAKKLISIIRVKWRITEWW